MTLRPSHRFRQTIAVLSIIAGFLSACAWIVNRPEVLAHALAVANAKSSWQMQVNGFRWKPIQSEIDIQGIELTHRQTGKKAHVERAEIAYRLLGLLRGRLLVDELVLRDVSIELPSRSGEKKKRKRRHIDPARFLIFKHIELVEGRVEGLNIAFGKDALLAVDEMRLSLIPSLFGASQLAIRTDGVKLDKADRNVLSSGSISIKTSTDIERWGNDFPYINAFTGGLRVQDAMVEGMGIDSIDARIGLEGDVIELSNLNISIDERLLLGNATVNLEDQSFDIAIDIPSPIELPYIGKDMKTLDTGGKLSGKVRMRGKGLVPTSTEGRASVDLTHAFSASPNAPVHILTDVRWKQGVFTISDAALIAGDDLAAISGTIDVPGKRMSIKAVGEHFPIEHLFEKFKNPHLAKIFGRADFTASIEGWGKKFKAHVEGVTYDGGWKPIKAEKILISLEATYDDLTLVGTVLDHGAQVGKADLHIAYGARMADGTRRKDIDLDAQIMDMDLAYPLEAFGLSGKGNGSIVLKGPHNDFHGLAKARIEQGDFHGLDFDRAAAELDITRKQLEFKNIEIALPKSETSKFKGTLIGDFSPGRLHLHGDPIEGLSIDTTYLYDSKRWNITGIEWKAPHKPEEMIALTGSFVSGGQTDLKLKGTFDANILSAATSSIRDNQGPMSVDLSARGASDNPRLYGNITFDKTSLTLRDPRLELTSLTGSILFDGSTIAFEDMVAEMDDGTASISGHLTHEGFRFRSADLLLDAKSMTYRSDDGAFNLEVDGRISMKGAFPAPTLSGDVAIIDGRYTKDFTILDVLTSKKKSKAAIKKKQQKIEEGFNPKLALHIRNNGDMEIKNNVGEIFLNLNVEVGGTRAKPTITGSIDAQEGFVDYLGLSFDITRGFVEFRGDGSEPYLEVYAEKEVRVYNVNLTLYGPIDNLKLDLSATSPYGPLEKRDVVSLILFGSTEQERELSRRSSGEFGATMAASGVAGVIGGPLSRLAHLDTFRLEAADAESSGVSKLNVGKEVSDRLTVQFATDIGVDNAVQTFAAEYLITDNLLIKGQRSTDSNYKISGILRFRLR